MRVFQRNGNIIGFTPYQYDQPSQELILLLLDALYVHNRQTNTTTVIASTASGGSIDLGGDFGRTRLLQARLAVYLTTVDLITSTLQ